MSYNYWIAKKIFDKKWERLRSEYEEAGMSKEDIDQMYEYDYSVFKAERLYKQRTVIIEPSDYDPREDCCSNLPMDKISNTDEKSAHHSRYWWVEEIEDPYLASKIKELSDLELEIITLYVFEGFDQTTISQMIGRNQSFVSRKISKIKQTLGNFRKSE